MLFRFLVFFFICLIFPVSAQAQIKNNNISLELHNADLPDTLRLLAKFMHINVMISPSVTGTTTLNFSNASPNYAFNMVLNANGLAASRSGSMVLVAPQSELIKLKQEELKWQELSEESASVITKIWQIKYAKVEEIARLLQDDHASLLSKRGRLRTDARTNSLFIEDIAARMTKISRLIERVDVPVQQILIEARLVSIDSDFERELGIQFMVKPTPEAGHYSLAVAKLADGSLLDVKLSALENAGHAELISSPSLFTANQQLASIEAGEEVPYQEVSESGGTAVVFKKAVLGLKVLPQILPKNRVLLQLQINQDRPSNKMVQGMPTISTRQMVANVLAKNGQTIVLGGIYEANTESGQSGLPFLNRVPILCWLFQQHNVRKNKRELLIFVRPKIINEF